MRIMIICIALVTALLMVAAGSMEQYVMHRRVAKGPNVEQTIGGGR
jgi:hypothetical protein